MWAVWLWCSHFEHSDLEDLRNLAAFMEEAMRLLSTSRESASGEVLDAIAESVVLAFQFPREDTVELLKRRGVAA